MAKKKGRLDQSRCSGCGCCAGTYPGDFRIGDSGLAEPIADTAEEDAASICPVGAISVEE